MKRKNYLDFEKSDSTKFMRDVCIDLIYEKAKNDHNIFFISPDMGAPSLDKFRENLPKQFIHAGICEQHMISMAGGLALMGKKVFCYAMAPFITSRCYEQIKCSISAMDLNITLIGIGVGLGYADAGPTHYTTEDIATMRAFPNIEIATPSDNLSTTKIIDACFNEPKFRFIRLDRDILPDIYNSDINFDLSQGWAKIYGEGNKCIISCGYLLNKLFSFLQKNDVNNIELVDFFNIKKNPSKSFVKYLSKFEEIVTIEEQCLSGGFGSIILEILSDNDIIKKVRRVGLKDKYFFENGGRDFIHKKNGLDLENILKNLK